jgi:hypothetical protein
MHADLAVSTPRRRSKDDALTVGERVVLSLGIWALCLIAHVAERTSLSPSSGR